MQGNHQTFSTKAWCHQLLLFTSSMLISTWQKLHSNLINQISEAILQFLLHLQPTDTTSDVAPPDLKHCQSQRAFGFCGSAISETVSFLHTIPCVNSLQPHIPWCSFQNIPLQVLVVYTFRHKTQLSRVCALTEEIRSSHIWSFLWFWFFDDFYLGSWGLGFFKSFSVHEDLTLKSSPNCKAHIPLSGTLTAEQAPNSHLQKLTR